jgi:hypothetical protein
MKDGMVRIELRRRVYPAGGKAWTVKTATAVYRPASIAYDWAKEKNAKLDFYGDRRWVVCDEGETEVAVPTVASTPEVATDKEQYSDVVSVVGCGVITVAVILSLLGFGIYSAIAYIFGL